ncbi:hypothetical protein THIOSC15_1370003 [uncultured Thiomicrorhabdus sp.]
MKLADSSLRVSLAKFSGDEWQKNPEGLQVSFGQQSLLSGEIVGELDSWYQWQAPKQDSVLDEFDSAVSGTAAVEQVPLMNIERQQRFYSPAVVGQQPSSSRPWKFFDRPVDLTIKPLPSFLPPQVLLGQLNLQPQAMPMWGQQGDLLYWQWQISGAQMSQTDFQTAMQQLLAEQPKNVEFEWFAPSIEFSEDQLNQAQLRIPLRLLTTGEVALPQWQWRYFDLQSGKLLVEQAPQQSIWVLAPWHLYSLYLLAAFLTVCLVLLLLAIGYFYWQRQRLLQWLKSQQRANQLAPQLWLYCARLNLQPQVHSWLQWQQQMGIDTNLRESLEKAAYASSKDGAWRDALCVELSRQHFSCALLKAYTKHFATLLSNKVRRLFSSS